MPAHAFQIRAEEALDTRGIAGVHELAFPTPAEARLVDALRASRDLLVSIVALCRDDLTGHIAFSPVTLDRQPAAGAGLAPVAVNPRWRSRGIGSALVTVGLEECKKRRLEFVVVLGEPAYYSRFGFQPASRFGLSSIYDAGDAFMAVELRPGALAGRGGVVRYCAAFDAL